MYRKYDKSSHRDINPSHHCAEVRVDTLLDSSVALTNNLSYYSTKIHLCQVFVFDCKLLIVISQFQRQLLLFLLILAVSHSHHIVHPLGGNGGIAVRILVRIVDHFRDAGLNDGLGTFVARK